MAQDMRRFAPARFVGRFEANDTKTRLITPCALAGAR
jgi:hypothetical protein